MTSRLNLKFLNHADGAHDLDISRASWLLVVIIGALLFFGLVWAALAHVEEVTRGDGRVIPSQQVQVVQVLEAGLVERIMAREGDIVADGQVLMRIDDTGFSSQLGEIRQRRFSLILRIARLEAEANGRTRIEASPDIAGRAQAVLDAEQNLFKARLEKQAQDLAILDQQLVQRKQELQELLANERKLQQTVTFSEREFEINKNLRRQGVVSEIDMVRIERQLATTKGELDVVQRQIPRSQSAIVEVEERLKNAESAFRSQAREELTKAQADLSVLDETIKAASDRVTRTTLKSPVRGIINKLNVTTIGAVVQPGQNIVEIVPLEDTLLIETRVRPQDVAFLHPNQRANVKITAYDYSIYGTLPGVVERISADAITNDKGEAFYRVIVRTDKNFLGSANKPLPIIPGMVASVDILTGEKTVLAYLMKPLTKARSEALRER